MSATICARCSRQQHDACTTAACSCAQGDHKRIAAPELVVVWEAPPANHRGRKSSPPITAQQIAELEAHPAQWARVKTWTSKTSANSAMTRIRKGRYPSIDAEKVEVTTAVVGEGSAMWARWIGDPS